MRVKSYYGANIREALDKARRELGAEAAIVASRQVRPEEGIQAAYEVICGVPEGPAAVPTPSVAPSVAAQTRPAPTAARTQPGKQQHGLARIRKPVDAVREALSRSPEAVPADTVPALLAASGFSADMAAEILAGVRQRRRNFGGKGQSPCPPDAHLLDLELAGRLRVAPEVGRILALIGPPGAGKTTTLVKLAARYGIARGRSMHIISMDSYRIGGCDALRTYAAAMATSFESLETANALAQSLEEHAGKSLILVDTAGLGPADMSANSPLASVLSRHTGVDVHLVLPATMGVEAMAGVVGRFRPFLPSKFLVTSADAAPSCRAAAALAIEHDKPVSFIATGQVIPEDIVEASAERLLGLSVPAAKREAISAA